MNDVTNGQLHSVSIRTEPGFTFGHPAALGIKGLLQSRGSWRNYDITPDGKQFVVLLPPDATKTEATAPQIQVVLNWLEEVKRLAPR